MRSAIPYAITLSVACAAPNANVSASGRDAFTAPDSLVLERTRCFGFCPAYRLRITSGGKIEYQPQSPLQPATPGIDSTRATALSYLVGRARAAGFFGFPSKIMGDAVLCAHLATDHPTATVTIFAKDSAKRVADYLGCFGSSDSSTAARLAALRAFENGIDTVLGSSRWVRPVRLK